MIVCNNVGELFGYININHDFSFPLGLFEALIYLGVLSAVPIVAPPSEVSGTLAD